MSTYNLTPLNEQVYNTTHRVAHAQIKELDKKYVRINYREQINTTPYNFISFDVLQTSL